MGSIRGAWRALVDGVKADHATMRRYQSKYAADGGDAGALPIDLVKKVGFQIMAAYRVMRFFDEAGVPLAPLVTSRLIRHLYSSDIHWKAQIEPGVMIVHGMGLAISKSATVRSGAILFQHVTLGEASDPATRTVGGPVIENDVHVGAGATIVGPIRVGARSKVMASTFVRASVPDDSLVEAAAPTVRPRGRGRDESA